MSSIVPAIIQIAVGLMPVTGLVVYIQSKIYGDYLINIGVNAIWRSMIYSLLGAVAGILWYAKDVKLNTPAYDSVGLMDKLVGYYNDSPELMFPISIAIYFVTFFFTVSATFTEKRLYKYASVILVFILLMMIGLVFK
jgi:hypothetical protein